MFIYLSIYHLLFIYSFFYFRIVENTQTVWAHVGAKISQNTEEKKNILTYFYIVKTFNNSNHIFRHTLRTL